MPWVSVGIHKYFYGFLNHQLCLVSTCLSAAEEEKEIFKNDLQNLRLSKEMMIKSAWNTRYGTHYTVSFDHWSTNTKEDPNTEINNFRDEAVDAKNSAEVDLAKNRIEMMQVRKLLICTYHYTL